MKGIKKKFSNEKSRVPKKKIVSETRLGPYTVIKLKETGTTLFDCIPDIWFTSEDRDRCLWPPPKGKNVAIRALKQEVPDDTWEIYDCEVVKGGFGELRNSIKIRQYFCEIALFTATYSCGRALVREKCSQNYNTSSADEYLQAANFRRQHPGLSSLNLESFEDLFAKKKTVNSVVNCETEKRTNKPSKNGNKKSFLRPFY